jgi:hypothetical protein
MIELISLVVEVSSIVLKYSKYEQDNIDSIVDGDQRKRYTT